jgi:RNA 2',3'-cyclic 3'-phosphodiesterase
MRLFFALQPTPAQSEALLAQVAPLFAAPGIAAIPATNMHATLCFLGAVAEENLSALRAAAARVRSSGVSLSFDALEYWPKPKIICATGPESGSASAGALARVLTNEVVAAGFTPDIKPFRAHLTLARKIPATRAQSLALPCSLQPGFVVRSANFVLMESRRGKQGSIYSVVDSWHLYEKEESRVPQ